MNLCKALTVKLDQPEDENVNDDMVTMRLVDLARNEVEGGFKSKRVADNLLAENGTLLFQQDLLAVSVGDTGYRMEPTGNVRILDTKNGRVVRTSKLDHSGESSRLFCQDQSERIVLSEPGQLHLIDLSTLSIIASRKIPFDRYFVF